MLEEFLDFGYTKKQYENIIKSCSLETLSSNFKKNNEYLLSIGYTNDDIKRAGASTSSIYRHTVEEIIYKLS